MTIRKATADDIDQLVNLRLDYIRADWGSLPAEEEKGITAHLRPYLTKHLPAGDFVGMLAVTGDTMMGFSASRCPSMRMKLDGKDQ